MYMKYLNKDVPYYPDYKIEINCNGESVISTFLRKEKNDKWYTRGLRMKAVILDVLIREFHEEAYRHLVLDNPTDSPMVIDDTRGLSIAGWIYDDLQISERERFTKL